MPLDPIVVADELCELLGRPDVSAQGAAICGLVRGAGSGLGRVLVELARRGRLAAILPARPSAEATLLVEALLASADDEALRLLAGALLDREDDYAAACVGQLVLAAAGRLPALFASLVAAGRYVRLRTALRCGGVTDSPALRALASARPGFGHEVLNAPALAALRGGRGPAGGYALLVVPGYTPPGAGAPQTLHDVARQRLQLAREDLAAGVAPAVLVTGGCVHPDGTPHNEALLMREHLLAGGVRQEQIVVEPYARHSTTNLRNAGRVMRAHGLHRALVVTGFDAPVFSQAFYFAHPNLSTFHARCREELGYVVGELDAIDGHRVAFRPAPEVDTPNFGDPLDV